MIDLDSMNGKPRTIYIWEGNNTTAITKGLPLYPYENDDGEQMFATKVKYRGLMKKFKPALNLNELDVSPPTRLVLDGSPVEGWEVVKLYIDIIDGTPNRVHRNFSFLARMQSILNDRNRYKKLYYEERRKNRTRTGEDRLSEYQVKQFKHYAKLKSEFYSSNYDPWMGGFSNRWGVSGQQSEGEGI
jgi:hypothetical protein